MAQLIYLRLPRRRWPATAVLCVLALAAPAASQAQTADPPAQITEATQGKHQVRAAQDAYLAGAKHLEHNDMTGAERDFTHALQLDPGNTDYVVAISVARQHRLTELIQQAGKARLAGDPNRADTLLAEARAIDPTDPIVLEHTPAALQNATQQPGTPSHRGEVQITPLTDRTQMLSAANAREPWKLPTPSIAGPIQLQPTKGTKDFHLRGDAYDVLRRVADAFGIRTVLDDSIVRKEVRFDLEKVDYKQAMAVLMSMTHVFAVPIDETSVLIAKDDATNRQRLERMMEETIFLPGFTPEQIADLGNVMRNIFQVKEAIVESGLGDIVVRAPADVLGPMNLTIQDLIDGGGEVLLDVKMYEVETTRTRDIGATIPTQIGFYNVDAAALSLVSANQALVQQAIAQGFIPANATNIQIALALLASGLVQNSVLSNTIGFFGNGLTKTGITSSTQATFNLGLNASDNRALDDVQMRVGDRQPATFRAGTRYPIVTSTYATGVASPASALGSATINGVSVASLLSQFSGGSGGVTPQVTYEDLGVTLKATPVVQKSGRINLTLDMKIEALAGGTLNGNPILASRQFSSDITVGDGESAMMVSELDRTESVAVAGIPGLSELPGFQLPISQNAEKNTGQLVVLVTPHIVRRRTNMIAGPRILVRALDVPAN
jgi:general secretion pathway protein D